MDRFLVNVVRAAVVAPAVLFAGHGCDDSGARVYTAQAYDSAADCLGHYAPLDRVEAKDLPSTCEPVCLTVGGQLYLSTVCAPYPAGAEIGDAMNAECAAALARLSAGGFCDDDVVDAGTDGEISDRDANR